MTTTGSQFFNQAVKYVVQSGTNDLIDISRADNVTYPVFEITNSGAPANSNIIMRAISTGTPQLKMITNNAAGVDTDRMVIDDAQIVLQNDAGAAFTVNNSGVAIDASAAGDTVDITTGTGDLTLSTVTGSIQIKNNADDLIEISNTGISIDTSTSNNAIDFNAGTGNFTVAASNFNVGTTSTPMNIVSDGITLNAQTGAIDIDGAAITMTGTGLVTFDTTGGANMELRPSGNLTLHPAGDLILKNVVIDSAKVPQLATIGPLELKHDGTGVTLVSDPTRSKYRDGTFLLIVEATGDGAITSNTSALYACSRRRASAGVSSVDGICTRINSSMGTNGEQIIVSWTGAGPGIVEGTFEFKLDNNYSGAYANLHTNLYLTFLSTDSPLTSSNNFPTDS